MSGKIKDFFKKKKVEAKFKLAGGGNKLGELSSSQQGGSASGSRQQKPAAVRQHPSSSAQQAGAAALNRINQSTSADEDFKKNRQRALIKEQARRELEREQKIDEEVEKLKKVYGDNKPEELEAPTHLASKGVFFKCPLVGEEVLPRDQMKTKIKDFLYAQLELERGLTAVLIIHTCNSPRDRVQVCVETLCKYIDNILKNPTEEKFRKIRRSNKAFKERVAALEGAEEFLVDCGFKVCVLPGTDGQEEEFWVLDESSELEHVAMLQDSLQSCEPLTAELDRGLTIIQPGAGGGSIGSLPPDFFSLSSEEVKREQQGKSEVVERENMLRTKAMRDKEAALGRKKYKYCLIRIRFPDGFILQGTFAVHEQFSAVTEFVAENLETPLPFQLLDNVNGAKLSNQENSLTEFGLVPASLLNFCWDPEIEADLTEPLPFLKSSLTNLKD